MNWSHFCPPPFRFLRWFSLRPSDGVKYGGIVERWSSFDRIISNLSPRGFNLYFGLNFTNRWDGIRIKSEDVTHAGALIFDLDPVAATPQLGDGLAAAKKAVQLAENHLNVHLQPCYIFTGRGVQAWALIDPIHLPDRDAQQRWRQGVGSLLQTVSRDLGTYLGYRLDTSCSDLARVVRLPGSVNHKTGFHAHIIEPGARVSLAPAPNRFPETFGLGFRTWSVEPVAPQDSLTLDKVWSHLSVTARRFIADGVDEPGRHAACFASAASLREAGMVERSTLRILRTVALRCGPPLPPAEVDRCVRNAYMRDHLNSDY